MSIEKLIEKYGAGGPVSLEVDQFVAGTRVLNLAPHPDDFDIAAVTFKRMEAAGCALHLSVLTSGAAGVQDEYGDPPDWATKSATREQEQRNACAFFGLADGDLEFLRMPEAEDGELVEDANALRIFEQQILSFDPEIVVIPHGVDTNAGHRRTFRLVMRVLPLVKHPVLVFCNLDPKSLEVEPNTFTWFGDDEAEWKREMLLCHDTQHQRNLNTRGSGLDDRILGLNADLATKHGAQATYVEAFEVMAMNYE